MLNAKCIQVSSRVSAEAIKQALYNLCDGRPCSWHQTMIGCKGFASEAPELLSYVLAATTEGYSIAGYEGLHLGRGLIALHLLLDIDVISVVPIGYFSEMTRTTSSTLMVPMSERWHWLSLKSFS